MYSDERRGRIGIIKLSELNMYIILVIYFILAVEYDLYNFFSFGSLVSGTVLTLIQIVLLLFVILTSRRFNYSHLIMYVCLMIGIVGTYFFNPSCKEILQQLFFEGSSIKKVFLLPLAVYSIKGYKQFVNKLYVLVMIEGYMHVLCNAIWGYGYNEWGVFNYMTYGMAIVTPTCLIMHKMFVKPSKFNIFTFVVFELSIVLYAHRGALLVTLVMALIFFIKYVKVSNKILIGTAGMLVFVLFIMFRTQIIQTMIDMLGTTGIESRTLEKLLSGDITNDSERSIIWYYIATGIISNIPFGYGIGADRLLLESKMRAGLYAHNLIMEICYDFGIVIGLFVVGWIVKLLYNCLTKIEDEDWYSLIVPFFVPSVVTLMTSASIYQYWLFWLSLGFYYCYFGRNNLRRKKK